MCLVTVNATIDHRLKDVTVISTAEWETLLKQQIYPFLNVTAGPRDIIQWYETIMEKSGGDARFTLGPMDDTLSAVATLRGTPMCTGHLWQEAAPQPRGRM
jgi:hypothetical protein